MVVDATTGVILLVTGAGGTITDAAAKGTAKLKCPTATIGTGAWPVTVEVVAAAEIIL